MRSRVDQITALGDTADGPMAQVCSACSLHLALQMIDLLEALHIEAYYEVWPSDTADISELTGCVVVPADSVTDAHRALIAYLVFPHRFLN